VSFVRGLEYKTFELDSVIISMVKGLLGFSVIFIVTSDASLMN
jgi:hypothetical protein